MEWANEPLQKKRLFGVLDQNQKKKRKKNQKKAKTEDELLLLKTRENTTVESREKPHVGFLFFSSLNLNQGKNTTLKSSIYLL